MHSFSLFHFSKPFKDGSFVLGTSTVYNTSLVGKRALNKIQCIYVRSFGRQENGLDGLQRNTSAYEPASSVCYNQVVKNVSHLLLGT